MIQPEDIRRKADNLYPLFLRAWLTGDGFFPRLIPSDKGLEQNLAAAVESIQRLRDESKESRGFGYTIEWKERKSRTHGSNLFPHRITFETRADLLRYIGRQREFDAFAAAVERIRSRYPVLEGWIRSHPSALIEAASDIIGLLDVVDYLHAHPRPGLFAREMPLEVDTKFIERNRRLLRDWLDAILPPHTIRADEEHFDRRFGLRYAEPNLLIRFLDDNLQRRAGSPWKECAVPLHALAAQPIDADRVLIVENKVNLLTLPPLAGTLALGGLGNGAIDLRYLEWLNRVELWYWGDIDVDGLQILSRLRQLFPRLRSLLMDVETVHCWKSRIGSPVPARALPAPANLTPPELAAYEICAQESLRIEQERFPQAAVLHCLPG